MPLSRSPACSRLAIGSNWSEVIAFGLLLPWRPPAQILPVWRIDRVAKLSVTREEEEGGGQYFKVAALVEMDPLSLSARLSLLLQAVNQRSPPPLSAAVAQEICDVAVRDTGVKLPACCLRYRCDIVCSWKAQLCIQLSELPGSLLDLAHHRNDRGVSPVRSPQSQFLQLAVKAGDERAVLAWVIFKKFV